MEMKLSAYGSPWGRILILDTEGSPPDWRQRQLLGCRSLTLPWDGLLAGPMNREQPFQVLELDLEGLERPLGRAEAAAFGRFLRERGWTDRGAVWVSDGQTAYVVPTDGPDWQAVPAPCEGQIRDLLSL